MLLFGELINVIARCRCRQSRKVNTLSKK